MRFEVRGVRTGTNDPVQVELEAVDAASVVTQAAQMGISNVQIRQLSAGAAPPPVAAPAYGGAAAPPPPAVPAAYTASPPAYSPTTPPAYGQAAAQGSSALRLWLGIGIPVAVLVIVGVILMIIFLRPGGAAGGGAGGGAAGARLDAHRYMPEIKASDSLIIGSINVESLLAQASVADLRKETGLDQHWGEANLNITPEDIKEMLLVLGGNLQGQTAPAGGVVFRLGRDMGIEEISKKSLGTPKEIQGFTVYEAPREFSRAVMAVPALAGMCGRGTGLESLPIGLAQLTPPGDFRFQSPRAHVLKVGAATYMVVPPSTDRTLETYLKGLKEGKSGTYPSGLSAVQERAGTGDVVLFGDLKIDPAEAPFPIPQQFAAALTVRSSLTLTAAATFKDEASAKQLMEFYNQAKEKLDTLPVRIEPPVQSGATVSVRASGTVREVIDEMKKQPGMFPF